MSPRRRRVVILCCLIAVSSGLMGTLLRNHPIGRVVWLAVIVVALVYAMVEFAKLKKEEG
jgi:energy-converting hydrogenase Eha subunit C